VLSRVIAVRARDELPPDEGAGKQEANTRNTDGDDGMIPYPVAGSFVFSTARLCGFGISSGTIQGCFS
jgi:hypothetical protein